VEQVRVEPETWRKTPMGKELHVDLFEVFMGVWSEYEVPMILEEYHLIDETEFNAVYERLSEENAESLLNGYAETSVLRLLQRQVLALTSRRTAMVEIAGAPQT
jgi:hypothetical protein